MDDKSDTPKTDAEQTRVIEASQGYLPTSVTAEFARTLERENRQLRGLLSEAVEHLAELCKGEYDDPEVGIFGWNDCHRVVAEAQAVLEKDPIHGR